MIECLGGTKVFTEGREEVEDDKYSERLVTFSETGENVKKGTSVGQTID